MSFQSMKLPARALIAVPFIATVMLTALTGRISGVDASARGLTSHDCRHVPAYGWLHTRGAWIVDKNGCKVRLEGVNWFGMETTNYVPDGLNYQTYSQIIYRIKRLGFNTIRLPISEQMVRYNSELYPRRQYIKDNMELAKLHPLDILDRIVAAARKARVFIILDNHGSLAASPKSSHIEATWTYYTEQGWINDWITLARRYRNDPTVVGFDLRNEPHTHGPGPWTLKTYLTQGATWGRYPSRLWNPSSNWPAAATDAGNQILAVNPHLLMFVEGVQLYPDPNERNGVETYWWGSILKGVPAHPIVFKVPHQLVYSPHEWGPRRTTFDFFDWQTNYARLAHLYYSNWAFILQSKRPVVRNPIWLGEFGTCNFANWCVRNNHHGSQGQWFQILTEYLTRNPEIGWSYYPINGTNSVDHPSDNSILGRDWKRVQLPALMQALRPAMAQPANSRLTGR